MPDPNVVTAAVGRRVRAERSRRGWTLDELAARSGVSKGMLVQVEQVRCNPSIATICRLADALAVSVASLVEAPEMPTTRVVRGDQGVPLWAAEPGSLAKLMVGSGTSDQVELWDVRMAAGDAMVSEPHPQDTRELLLVVQGELTMEVDGASHLLGAGDAIAFLADRPHTYRNAASDPLRYALAVVHRGETGKTRAAPAGAERLSRGGH
jgi:transcriptional regulator with XRE-family HTH domain